MFTQQSGYTFKIKKNKHCQESKLTLVSAGEVQVAMESVDVYSAVLLTVNL